MFFQLWLIDWFVRPVTHNPSSPSKLLVLKSHTRNLEAIACILFCPSFRPWMHDRLAKFLVRDSVPVTCTENLGRVSWALAYVTLCHAWFTLSVVNSSICPCGTIPQLKLSCHTVIDCDIQALRLWRKLTVQVLQWWEAVLHFIVTEKWSRFFSNRTLVDLSKICRFCQY